MKTFKLSIGAIVILLLLFAITSCKKNGDKDGPENGPLDLTQYYIVGKFTYNTLKMPYIITFDPNAKSNCISVGINSQANWTFADGVLTLDFGGGDKDTFKIADGKITSFEGADKLETYSLEKLPETNLFNGNSYSGGWVTPGSNLQLLARFKFNATQYGEASLTEPVINTDYTLIKNVAATSNTGVAGTLTFYVIMNGKLEAARFKSNYSTGSFTKQ